jgi:hypothetical protein
MQQAETAGGQALHRKFRQQRKTGIMRIWFKMVTDAHLVKTETIEDNSSETRTHKIFAALEEVCMRFDLSKPIWLESNISEFQKRARTRFHKDNFVDEIDFDYLEIHVLDED